MSCHEAKYCPRCKNAFECKPGNIAQCQCYGITFSEQEKEYIRTTYSDCLCSNCLHNIKHEMKVSAAEKEMQAILSIFKR
jgi:hypothetical protein